VPAIVSASAGVAEQYPPELAGLLIADPDDPAELRAKLLAWRHDMEHFRAAVAPLSAMLRSHTWDAMAEQIAACALEPA
jgi:glycosyltransferase involved in cell wall biosynthesis